VSEPIQVRVERCPASRRPGRILGLILPWLVTTATAQSLYDAARSTLPAEQGWGYAAFPGQATQALDAAAARLDTWSTTVEQAGYARVTPVPLDRRLGFTLLFTVRVVAEAHGSADRAGFSLIVLDEERRGIELAFWTNAVFAQGDAPLFTQAELAAWDTASSFVDYALTLGDGGYVLRANGQAILAGPARDYTPFSGALDPYETPNFVFLGDDTTSARAVVLIRRVVLIPAPVLEITERGVVTWTGAADTAYTLERSIDLRTWTTVVSLTSETGRFAVTNIPAASLEFLRVMGP